MLILDDFHWADSASVELLGALLRRPSAAAVLLALGVCPRQMPERLTAALERAKREAGLTRIELGVLTPGEARELVGGAVAAEEAAALYEESGGNPFYLQQLARAVGRAAGAASATAEMLLAIAPPRPRRRRSASSCCSTAQVR